MKLFCLIILQVHEEGQAESERSRPLHRALAELSSCKVSLRDSHIAIAHRQLLQEPQGAARAFDEYNSS